jgi:uncharacterized RDD family membrane protein YckC
MFCPSCGANVAEGTAFCGSCGKPIIGYSIGQTSAPAVSVAAAAPPVAVAPGVYVARATTGDTGFYAGFWLRLVADIIDNIVLMIPTGFVAVVLFASMFPLLRGFANAQNPVAMISILLPRILLFAVIFLAGTWLYWGLFESSSWQATLGKKALGLYVTDLAGNRLTFGKASGRFFAGRGLSAVPTIGGLYYLVDCIMAGCTEKKQALHDMIAGCLVQRNP